MAPEPSCLACGSTTETIEIRPEGTVLGRTKRAEGRWVALVELEGAARVLAIGEERPPVSGTVQLEQDEEGFRMAPS